MIEDDSQLEAPNNVCVVTTWKIMTYVNDVIELIEVESLRQRWEVYLLGLAAEEILD